MPSHPLCFIACAALLACSSTPDVAPAAAGGAGSSAGTSAGGLGGSSTAAGTTSGGTTNGGAVTGGAAGAAVGGGGMAGMSGTGGGGSGGAGGGAGGGGFWGPNGPKKQWSCPPGPFGQQMRSNQKNVCQGFDYNYGYNEGPTWIASQNAFFFSNFIQGSNLGGDIIKLSMDGTCEVWLHEVGCNGLGVSPSGNLLAACHGPRAVMEYDVTTKAGRKVATMADGKLLDSPNDVIAHSNGTIYFSNTTYELGTGPDRQPGLKEALVGMDPTGKTFVIEAGGLNGVALSPDEKKLYVVQRGVWDLDATGMPLQKTGGGPGGDGLAMDCAGNVTADQTNSAYGGPDGKTLLIVQGETARTYDVTIPGLP